MIVRSVVLAILFAAASSKAADGHIIKVLNHLVDAQGRTALSPSLYERDAYQLRLRNNPVLAAGSKFEIQYKAPRSAGPVLLRLEVRGNRTGLGVARTFEKEVLPSRWFSSWALIELDKAASEALGSVVAWRGTLWRDGDLISEQQSFLW